MLILLQTGDFVHTMGDSHVYLNHIEQLKEQVSPLIFSFELRTDMYIHPFVIVFAQIYSLTTISFCLNRNSNVLFQLTREPRPFPKLIIKRKVECIDDFKFEDFEISGYDPHPKIVMEMAV